MTHDGERKDPTDGADLVSRISATDSRAARKLLGWSLVDLSNASAVDEAKLALFESGISLDAGAAVAPALAQAFEAAGLDYRPNSADPSPVEPAETSTARFVPGRPSGRAAAEQRKAHAMHMKAMGWSKDVMCRLLQIRHYKQGLSFWTDPQGRHHVWKDDVELPVRPDWIAEVRPLYDVVEGCARAAWNADPRTASAPFGQDATAHRASMAAAWACLVAYDYGRQLPVLARRARQT